MNCDEVIHSVTGCYEDCSRVSVSFEWAQGVDVPADVRLDPNSEVARARSAVEQEATYVFPVDHSELRVVDGSAEHRMYGEEWEPMTPVQLSRAFKADHLVWPWLNARGIRRVKLSSDR